MEETQRRTIAPNEKYCSTCGNIIFKEAEICPKCGVRQQWYGSPSSIASGRTGKNKIAAGVLALLLGGFGIHKFYLGQIGLGVLYLLFFWTFIPAIAGLIEGIIYLTMSDREFIAKYDS